MARILDIFSTLQNLICGFKFGGLVWDRHTYICEKEILADFNSAVIIYAKPPKFNSPPNFPAIRYARTRYSKKSHHLSMFLSFFLSLFLSVFLG